MSYDCLKGSYIHFKWTTRLKNKENWLFEFLYTDGKYPQARRWAARGLWTVGMDWDTGSPYLIVLPVFLYSCIPVLLVFILITERSWFPSEEIEVEKGQAAYTVAISLSTRWAWDTKAYVLFSVGCQLLLGKLQCLLYFPTTNCLMKRCCCKWKNNSGSVSKICTPHKTFGYVASMNSKMTQVTLILSIMAGITSFRLGDPLIILTDSPNQACKLTRLWGKIKAKLWKGREMEFCNALARAPSWNWGIEFSA